MGIIRVKPNWQDVYEGKPHPVLTRRDFLKRGLATTTLSTLAPTAVMAMLAKKAAAGTLNCPTSSRVPGGIAQLYRAGGPAVGASFLNATQVGFMTSTIASDYGFSGVSALQQYGSNWWVDPTSPFGMAVITPPPGWVGGLATWKAALARTTLGGHYGQFNADDAVGNSAGQLAGCGPMKPSQTGTDISINPQGPRASWAAPLAAFQPNANLASLTAAAIEAGFSMTPTASINSAFLTNTAAASDTLSQIFMSLFSNGKAGATQAYTNAACGFYGDSTIANSTFAGSLFDYTQLSALTSAMTVSALSPEMQAFLVAFYQSALGSIGVVQTSQSGCDYHPSAPQTAAAPVDYEAGQIFAMWLAASVIAQQNAAFIMNSNGRVHCAGTASNTFTPPAGTALTVNGPVSLGDGGGSYNAGMIMLYGVSSAPSGVQSTGTFNTTTGAVTAASTISSVPDAMAGLYLTALAYLGFNVPTALTLLENAGLSNPCAFMLISNSNCS
jgi:hypothetical protein